MVFSYDYQISSNYPNLCLIQEFQGPNLSLQIDSSQHYVDNTHQSIRRRYDHENEVFLSNQKLIFQEY